MRNIVETSAKGGGSRPLAVFCARGVLHDLCLKMPRLHCLTASLSKFRLRWNGAPGERVDHGSGSASGNRAIRTGDRRRVLARRARARHTGEMPVSIASLDPDFRRDDELCHSKDWCRSPSIVAHPIGAAWRSRRHVLLERVRTCGSDTADSSPRLAGRRHGRSPTPSSPSVFVVFVRWYLGPRTTLWLM